MSAPLTVFTTTDLSRSSRRVLSYAREHPRTGALIRDGEDGTLLRLALARDDDGFEVARRYLDTLIPLVVRGVEGESSSDFAGAGWLIHLPVEARSDFVRGALDRLLQGVDGLGFSELDRWFDEWREEALLHRAGILGTDVDQPTTAEVSDRPRRRR